MQEVINFEIGDKSYNLVGYNKELIENSTSIVKEKYEEITRASRSAITMESKFLLVALNIAEDLYLEKTRSRDLDKSNEYSQLIIEMKEELNKVMELEQIA